MLLSDLKYVGVWDTRDVQFSIVYPFVRWHRPLYRNMKITIKWWILAWNTSGWKSTNGRTCRSLVSKIIKVKLFRFLEIRQYFQHSCFLFGFLYFQVLIFMIYKYEKNSVTKLQTMIQIDILIFSWRKSSNITPTQGFTI